MAAVLVTGTDTGIGKTRVATALLRALVKDGYRVVGMKPVASGYLPDRPENEDVLQLLSAGNVPAPLDDRCPYSFAPPIAPHLAARQVGLHIELGRLREAFLRLSAQADWVIVEGAGGPLVPLDDRYNLLDLAKELRLPVVLVVGLRLGCLNHALLAAEAIATRGLRLAGWVVNDLDPHMLASEENVAVLRERLTGPLLARFPGLTESSQVDSILLDSAPGAAMAAALIKELGEYRS